MGIVESAPFQMRTKLEAAETAKGLAEPAKVASNTAVRSNDVVSNDVVSNKEKP
jgi:hypothetical protein